MDGFSVAAEPGRVWVHPPESGDGDHTPEAAEALGRTLLAAAAQARRMR